MIKVLKKFINGEPTEEEQYKANEEHMWKDYNELHKAFVDKKSIDDLVIKLGFQPIDIRVCGFGDKENVVLACEKHYQVCPGFREDETTWSLEIILSVSKLDGQCTHEKLLFNWIKPNGNGADEEYTREY